MPMNFSWIEPGVLAGMACPSPDDWTWLAQEGVRAVLTLTERPAPGDPAGAGLEARHEPWADFGTPDVALLERCVAFLSSCHAAGKPAVVHCLAGQGRTGTVLAAWLVTRGHGPAEAVDTVRRARPHSIETAGQEQAVHRFAAWRAGGGGSP